MAKKKAKAKPKTERLEVRVACDLPNGMTKSEVKKMIADVLSNVCSLQNVRSEFI